MIDPNDVPEEGAIIEMTREDMGYPPLTPTPPSPTPVRSSSSMPMPTSPPFETSADGRTIEPRRGSRSPAPPPTYGLLTIEQLYDLQSPPWLVHGVIRQGEFVVIYGEPSCGKTFAALDLALKIAAELDWWGYRTFPGGVLYLAGEGAYGLKNRVKAWDCTRKPEVAVRGLNVRILPLAVAFLDPVAFQGLLDTLKREFPKPTGIFVDTLARHIVGGDENSAEFMGMFVARCADLQAATGASVIVIHHTTKDGFTERGSSALRGAADVMIQVTKNGDSITLRGDKAKDAERLEPIRLEFERIWLGVDEFDKPVHSLVLREDDSPRSKREDDMESDPGRVIRETLAKFFDAPAAGTPLRDETGIPKSTFYRALQEEQEEGRIDRIQDGRARRYFLTPDAPEYVAPKPPDEPSPSPTESQPVSGTPIGNEGAGGGQSQVPVPPTPLGVGMGRDWDSTAPDTHPLHPGEEEKPKRKRRRAKPSTDGGEARS